MDFYDWLNESVEQQKEYIYPKLQQFLFPAGSEVANAHGTALIKTFTDAAFNDIQAIEKELQSEEDIRKSYTVNRFLNKLFQKTLNQTIDTANMSNAHKRDMITAGLRSAVEAANLKYLNDNPESKEQYVKKMILEQLPYLKDKDSTLNLLIAKVLKGQKVQKVVDDYIISHQERSNFSTISDGEYEMIIVNQFVKHYKKEKHLDTGDMAECHSLFRGTKWCVRFPDYFSNYNRRGPLYLIRKHGKPFLLGHKDSKFLDVNDESATKTDLQAIAPLVLKSKKVEIIKWIVPYLPNGINDISEKMLPNLLSETAGCKFFGKTKDGGIKISNTFESYSGIFRERNDFILSITRQFKSFINPEKFVNNYLLSLRNSSDRYIKCLIDNIDSDLRESIKYKYNTNSLLHLFMYSDDGNIFNIRNFFQDLLAISPIQRISETCSEILTKHGYHDFNFYISNENGKNFQFIMTPKVINIFFRNCIDDNDFNSNYFASTDYFEYLSKYFHNEIIGSLFANIMYNIVKNPLVDKEKFNDYVRKKII